MHVVIQKKINHQSVKGEEKKVCGPGMGPVEDY